MQSNIVCKEHEWVENKFTALNVGIVSEYYCKKCGRVKSSADFKIEENLSQINKQEWEDILNEFAKVDYFDKIKSYERYDVFLDWLEENYLPPEKKNV